MKCEICNQTVPTVSLFRVSPIGELPAIWRCEECLTPDQADEIDPMVKEITTIIHEDGKDMQSK